MSDGLAYAWRETARLSALAHESGAHAAGHRRRPPHHRCHRAGPQALGPHPTVFGSHEVWHTFVVGANACHYALVTPFVQASRGRTRTPNVRLRAIPKRRNHPVRWVGRRWSRFARGCRISGGVASAADEPGDPRSPPRPCGSYSAVCPRSRPCRVGHLATRRKWSRPMMSVSLVG
jgi:hypothetical protein